VTARLFQYAKSADLEVVQTCLANREGRNAFMQEALAWANERGSDKPLYSAFFGRYTVAGLPVMPEGRGRWTQRRNAFRPYKNNRAENNAIEAITFSNKPIPGLPEVVYGKTNRDWSRPIASPTPFVHEGIAYVGIGFIPDPEEQRGEGEFGEQWVEILPSEFHAANEALTGKRVAS